MNTKIKNTKIVATLGPASAKEDVLEKMFKEGLNVIRMNFSHGDQASHQKNLNLFRNVA